MDISLEIGMGATLKVLSDNYPYTIIEIINKNKIVVQQDNAKRIDSNGISESQEYEYTPNTEAYKTVLTKRKDGRWRIKGDPITSTLTFTLCVRRMYQDPSF